MKTPFKKLLGNRVVIANFLKTEEPEGKPTIELLDSTKKDIQEEKAVSTQRFKVIQVGTACESGVEEGDEIYIESTDRVLNPQVAETIIEDGEIIGFIIPERQIAAIF
jgi:hypothetical protein